MYRKQTGTHQSGVILSSLTEWLPMRWREWVSFRAGRAQQALAHRSGQVLILAYHNIRPTGCSAFGERTVHLAQSALARQLDLLQRTHDVRPLADLETWAPRGNRPTAVITFDDGYRGALTAGVEELSRRGLPATFFIVPGRLSDHEYWWDWLAERHGGVISPEIRHQVLEVLGGDEDAIRAWGSDGSKGPAPAFARTVTESELRQVATVPGITLAPHTWTHPSLTRMPPARVDDELNRSRTWMLEQFPGSLSWISFPYGRRSAEVEGAAARAGYRGGLLIQPALAWVERPAATPNGWRVLPRLNIPSEMSFEAFALTTSGAWGV